jgi:hypothetical protein
MSQLNSSAVGPDLEVHDAGLVRASGHFSIPNRGSNGESATRPHSWETAAERPVTRAIPHSPGRGTSRTLNQPGAPHVRLLCTARPDLVDDLHPDL